MKKGINKMRMKKSKKNNDIYLKEPIDNLMREYLKKKELPISTKNVISDTCKNLKNKNNKMPKVKKILAMSCCLSVLIFTIVLAHDGKIKIKNPFFNESPGIKTAINNGFIYKENLEYVFSNNVGIKVNSFFMDDNYLGIELNLNFEDFSCNLSDEELSKNIEFEKVLIYDENNNILYYKNNDFLNEFVKERNIEDVEKNTINSGSNIFFESNLNNRNHIINGVYNLYSNKFPKSKKIFIEIENINIEEEKIVKGNWNISIDVPENMYDREIITSNVFNNDKNIEITKVVTSETNTRVDFYIKNIEKLPENKNQDIVEEMINEGKTTEEIRKKLEEYNKGDNKEWFEDVYIENETGKKFYQDFNLIEGNTIITDKEKKEIKGTFTLSLTKYDLSRELKLHFIFNNVNYTIKLTN